jgi:hypothetical protein
LGHEINFKRKSIRALAPQLRVILFLNFLPSVLFVPVRDYSFVQCRFLKQEQTVGVWHDVDEEVAREKASQCLRDIVAAITKGKVKTGRLKVDGEMAMSSGNLNSGAFDDGGKEGTMAMSVSTPSLHSVVSGAAKSSSIDVSKFFGHSKSAANFNAATASSPAAAAGLALMRGSATMANLGGGGNSSTMGSGNAQWNTNSFMMNNNNNNMFNNNIRQAGGLNAGGGMQTSNPAMGQSAAARAGLSLLRAGNPNAQTASSNAAFPSMSRIVSNTSSNAVNQTGHNPAAQAGLAMLLGNRAASTNSQLPNIRESGTAMQISTADLQDLANNSNNASGGYVNPSRQLRFGGSAANIVVDQSKVNDNVGFASPDDEGESSFAALERKRRFVSAPNLGNISSFLAKRQRSGGFQPMGQNATFNIDEMESLEPIQLEEFQRPRNVPTKAVSCVTLGGLKSASAMNLGSARRRQEGGYQDPLLRRLQTLRASIGGGNDGVGANMFLNDNGVSIEEDESQSSTGNFAWDNSSTGRPNMFASITQRTLGQHHHPQPSQPVTKREPQGQPSSEERPHNCFTGMGEVIGEEDDAALQRWIDRMAEEELS